MVPPVQKVGVPLPLVSRKLREMNLPRMQSGHKINVVSNGLEKTISVSVLCLAVGRVAAGSCGNSTLLKSEVCEDGSSWKRTSAWV